MASIFISYRRGATSDITYRIRDRLSAHFGRDHVFIDIENIPIGVAFPDHLANTLGKCEVVLAVIGQDWITARLQDPGDVLRQELELALENQVTLIPLLVHGARVPLPASLPDSLLPLTELHALSVDSGTDFDNHIERLIRGIEGSLRQREHERARRAEARELELAAQAREPIPDDVLGGRTPPSRRAASGRHACPARAARQGHAGQRASALGNVEQRPRAECCRLCPQLPEPRSLGANAPPGRVARADGLNCGRSSGPFGATAASCGARRAAGPAPEARAPLSGIGGGRHRRRGLARNA